MARRAGNTLASALWLCSKTRGPLFDVAAAELSRLRWLHETTNALARALQTSRRSVLRLEAALGVRARNDRNP